MREVSFASHAIFPLISESPKAVVRANLSGGSFRHILLKNSMFQLGVLESDNFRHIQSPEITFSTANFKELHSTCRCGSENLPEFVSQEFFNTIGTERTLGELKYCASRTLILSHND
jgi:hypothetical protein